MRIATEWALALTLLLAVLATPAAVQAGQRRHGHQAVRTPMTDRQLVHELDHAHRTVFGRDASADRLRCAWAQVALETGHGRQVHNWNLGNLGPTQRQAWHRFRRTGAARFASYGSAREAAIAYWRLLRDRFPRALDAMDRGDPAAAAVALQGRYYRAPLDKYRTAMVALYREGPR